jgi:hypothetical protein
VHGVHAGDMGGVLAYIDGPTGHYLLPVSSVPKYTLDIEVGY